ncbi:unnamed protein product [Protopolystoma xenopodis]|uniref:Uncharacterized protein n=1 Tax=Protopolystoma xenopodis TaxID=117903 RepID=A0A3S5BKS6_9PLAT|nr:unnamed protein product [Protopolystoma xenopodis]
MSPAAKTTNIDLQSNHHLDYSETILILKHALQPVAKEASLFDAITAKISVIHRPSSERGGSDTRKHIFRSVCVDALICGRSFLLLHVVTDAQTYRNRHKHTIVQIDIHSRPASPSSSHWSIVSGGEQALRPASQTGRAEDGQFWKRILASIRRLCLAGRGEITSFQTSTFTY